MFLLRSSRIVFCAAYMPMIDNAGGKLYCVLRCLVILDRLDDFVDK